MKKMMIFALSAIMVLSMVACGAPTKNVENNKQSTSENNQIPNPWEEASSMDEAQNEVGFDIAVPESIDGYTEKVIRTNAGTSIVEVIFRNKDNELRFRKGTGDGDISGDYNTYAEENTIELNGLTILMKGSDGKVHLATWSNGGYSYSIDSKVGLSKTEMTDFASYVSADQLIIGGDPATWEPAIEENVQIPNPFIDCDTLQDAASIAGFEVIVPASIAGYNLDCIQAIDKDMIQVFYVDDAENVILIRKAVGSENISGDYNTYTQEDTTTVGDMEVRMKGNDGLIYLAVWTSGDYTYSVSVHSGITHTSMADLIAEIQ